MVFGCELWSGISGAVVWGFASLCIICRICLFVSLFGWGL